MAAVTYVGPYPAVDSEFGHFPNGEPVEVSAAAAKALCQSEDFTEKPKPRKTSKES